MPLAEHHNLNLITIEYPTIKRRKNIVDHPKRTTIAVGSAIVEDKGFAPLRSLSFRPNPPDCLSFQAVRLTFLCVYIAHIHT